MIWQKPNILASRARRRGNGRRGQSVKKDTSAAEQEQQEQKQERAGSGNSVARNRKDRTGRDDRRDSRKPLDVWVPWSGYPSCACLRRGFCRNGRE